MVCYKILPYHTLLAAIAIVESPRARQEQSWFWLYIFSDSTILSTGMISYTEQIRFLPYHARMPVTACDSRTLLRISSKPVIDLYRHRPDQQTREVRKQDPQSLSSLPFPNNSTVFPKETMSVLFAYHTELDLIEEWWGSEVSIAMNSRSDAVWIRSESHGIGPSIDKSRVVANTWASRFSMRIVLWKLQGSVFPLSLFSSHWAKLSCKTVLVYLPSRARS